MKIICENYGCGTSSAFHDYKISDLVFCSEQNHQHIFDIKDEDLFFVGHEFLMYLWGTEKYRNHWKNYSHRKIIWCFEKIDCIVPMWKQKSHYSLNLCQQFTSDFLASDEQDCRKYNIPWFPQWASNRFYNERSSITPTESRATFSGQAGVIGYSKRDALIRQLQGDSDLKDKFYVSNTTRSKSWDDYIKNFLSHKVVLAPFGNLKAFNTRTFEALTSGRWLLQQVDKEYEWHVNLLSQFKNVSFFETFDELKALLLNNDPNEFLVADPIKQYELNNLFSRFDKISELKIK